MKHGIVGSSPLSLLGALAQSKVGHNSVIYEPRRNLLGAWARSNEIIYNNNVVPQSTTERSSLPRVREFLGALDIPFSETPVQLIQSGNFEWNSELTIDLGALVSRIHATPGIEILRNRVDNVVILDEGVRVNGTHYSSLLLPEHFSHLKFHRSGKSLAMRPRMVRSQHLSLIFKSPPPSNMVFAPFQIHMPLDDIFDRAQFLARSEVAEIAFVGRIARSAKHLKTDTLLCQSKVLSVLRQDAKRVKRSGYVDYQFDRNQLKRLSAFLRESSCNLMSSSTMLTGLNWLQSNFM